MNRFSFILTLILSLFLTISCFADSVRIAAIVGNNIITTTTLTQRVKLVAATSGLPDHSPETLQSLFPQVLQALIDEALYRQEGERLKLSISEKEISKAIRSIEMQNQKAEGSLKLFIRSLDIPFSIFEEQIRSQLLWNKIVMLKIRPKLSLSQQEINAAIYKLYPKETELNYQEVRMDKRHIMLLKESNKPHATLQQIRPTIKRCEDLSFLTEEKLQILPKNHRTFAELDNRLQSVLVSLEVGTPSQIMEYEDYYAFFVVCERTTRPLQETERLKITESLLQKKLQTQSAHYLRELRRNTVIEIKLQDQ